jgi:DNA-binding response OmpR family regulator
MRIAIIGGNPDDERHLGRLADKAGHAATFLRSRAAAPALGPAPLALASTGHAPSGAAPVSGVLEHVLDRLERELPDELAPGRQAPIQRPRGLVFDAGQRPDAAARVIAAVRRDPYFDRVGALLILQAEHAAAIALPGGFDDFVLYPCGVNELAIRVRALTARRYALGKSSVSDDAVVVDEASRDVIVDGRAVQLTAREFALFTYLCEWRGRVLSREHLLARVWGSRYSGGRRTVDIHVRRLRAKLGASLAIETLRGSGYRLRREPSHADAAPESTPYPVSAPFAAESQPFEAQIPEPFSKVS